MNHSSFDLPVVITTVLSLLLTPLSSTGAGFRQDKNIGEVRQDAALVYCFAGWGKNYPLFCDDQLLAVVRSGVYSFGYISPGTHVMWYKYESHLCDFAAGQTYIWPCTLAGGLLNEADLKILKNPRYCEPTQGQRSEAAATIAEKWPELKAKYESKIALTSREVAYTPPTSIDNLIKIPTGTGMTVELMENLNSGLNTAGENVRFRTTEDVRVGDSLLVRAGTPVRALLRDAHKNFRFGQGGDIDVTIVSVPAADGTVCPLVGQATAMGAEWVNRPAGLGAAAAGGLAGTIVLNALMKGAVAFIPAGATFRAFTRQDIWIKPPQASGESESGVGKPPSSVRAYARSTVACNVVKGEVPQIVEIVFKEAPDITSAKLFAVSGWQIPAPISARSLSPAKEGWIAQFGGWDVCRFLRPGDTATQLAFCLTTADGGTVIAQGALSMALK